MLNASDHRLLQTLRGFQYGAPLAALAGAGPAWSEEPLPRVLERWERGGPPADATTLLGLSITDLIAWVRSLRAELNQLAAEIDPLDLLEIGAGEQPTWTEVRDRYRRLSKESHPDRHPAGEHDEWAARQRALNAAWGELRDAARFESLLAEHRRRGAMRAHFGLTAGAAGAIVDSENLHSPQDSGGGSAHDARPFPLTARMAEDLFGTQETVAPPSWWERWQRRAGWLVGFALLAGGVALAIPALMTPSDVVIPRLRDEPTPQPSSSPAPIEHSSDSDEAPHGRPNSEVVDDHNDPAPAPRFGDELMPTLDLQPVATPVPRVVRTTTPAPMTDGADSRNGVREPASPRGPSLPASSASPGSDTDARRREAAERRREERALGDRLDDFLYRYKQAYEAESVAGLRALFHPAALQNGADPLDEIMENYARLFAGADGVRISMLRTGQRLPSENDAAPAASKPESGAEETNGAADEGGEVSPDANAVVSRVAAPAADLILTATFELEYVPTRRQSSAAIRRMAGVVTIGLIESPKSPGGFQIVSVQW